jgi:hypothetical protein
VANQTGVQRATVTAIIDNAGRATLPFERAHRPGPYATAFWFNELVETTADGEVVRQFLVTATRTRRGIFWDGDLPEGCVGAPVFTNASVGGNSYKLVCIGVALPRDGRRQPIATFDRIRVALRALADGTPEPQRRWWRRRS